jgi:hypothetical protein
MGLDHLFLQNRLIVLMEAHELYLVGVRQHGVLQESWKKWAFQDKRLYLRVSYFPQKLPSRS